MGILRDAADDISLYLGVVAAWAIIPLALAIIITTPFRRADFESEVKDSTRSVEILKRKVDDKAKAQIYCAAAEEDRASSIELEEIRKNSDSAFSRMNAAFNAMIKDEHSSLVAVHGRSEIRSTTRNARQVLEKNMHRLQTRRIAQKRDYAAILRGR
jgi:hypothetical protein